MYFLQYHEPCTNMKVLDFHNWMDRSLGYVATCRSWISKLVLIGYVLFYQQYSRMKGGSSQFSCLLCSFSPLKICIGSPKSEARHQIGQQRVLLHRGRRRRDARAAAPVTCTTRHPPRLLLLLPEQCPECNLLHPTLDLECNESFSDQRTNQSRKLI